MVISPNDFSLWSRLTGNKYPSTPKERAQKGPEVQRFIQNLDREGMIGGKQEEEQKKKRSLPEKLATGALIAGGVAAGVAAARDKRVQDVAQRVGSTVRDRTQEFLKNLGPGQEVDVDIVDASGDVTPNPREQQSNIAPQLKSGSESIKPSGLGSRMVGPLPDVSPATSVGYELEKLPDFSRPTTSYVPGSDVGNEKTEQYMRSLAQLDAFTKSDPERDPVSGIRLRDIDRKISESKQPVAVDRFKPVVGGETFGTSGAISRLEDIGDAKLRAERTYEPMINALQQKNPGINLGGMKRQMLKNAEKDRDFDIAYMVARGQGKDDAESVIIARQAAGFSGGTPKEPTEYRKFLGEQRTGSIIRAKIDDLINMVQPGQIARVEGVDQSNLDKYGTWQNNVQVSTNNATPDNKMLKPGAEIGGTTLVDQQATKMAVDNVLDNARNAYEKQVSTIIDAGKTSGGSIKSRAGAEAFLQKYRTNVVRNLDEAIQKDLQATTGLSPEDAANIALSVIDPITGQRQVDPGSVQKVGSKFVSKKVSRNPLGEKSVPNIDPDTNQGTMKTAVGTAIRGRAPSYYEAGFQTKERQDPLLLPGDEDTMISDRPSKERAQFVPTPFDKEQQSKEGGSAGIGIYGEGTGYLAGPFSKTASKAPTDVFGKSSPFKGVSDSTLTKLKSDMKPGTKSFESVDKEQKGRASMDAARELRKIQTSGDPNTATERVGKFLDNLKKLQGG